MWQIAYRLSLDLYRDTVKFPRSELYGLVWELGAARRATNTRVHQMLRGLINSVPHPRKSERRTRRESHEPPARRDPGT